MTNWILKDFSMPEPSFTSTLNKLKLFLFSFFLLETEGRHASAKARKTVDHMASFPTCREDILQPGFEPPTSSF